MATRKTAKDVAKKTSPKKSIRGTKGKTADKKSIKAKKDLADKMTLLDDTAFIKDPADGKTHRVRPATLEKYKNQVKELQSEVKRLKKKLAKIRAMTE
ncbi:MAG: hypothetical protein K6G03_10610 [Lachnospiraceae bacterium]|nr:hypothetical protein [Lachnospiraceae bacterium]